MIPDYQAFPDGLEPSKINLYCRTGRRSGIALETLKSAGYRNLTNLGSMENAAKELRLPIVK